MRTLEPTRSRVDDFAFSLEGRVRFHHTDAMGVMHHAAYLNFLEDTRVEYLRSIGRPYHRIRSDDGVDFAVIGVQLAYHAPLRFDDVFRIHAGVAHVRASSFAIEYLARHDDETVLSGFTHHAILNRDTGRPVRVPAWIAAAAG
jgi:acyl-CoA thioester hydrolase